ncbi:MAG: hypothetical protein IKC97_04435 [Clostridia bacterium]|nr:hypothetical protein [Clostridia bacterium]
MKIHLRAAALVLSILLLSCALCSCASRYDEALSGTWVITSFVTQDGTNATIENELCIVFDGNGHGEMRTASEAYYTFTYTARRGSMLRVIDYGRGEPEVVEETYTIQPDGTLTIVTPETQNAPAATIMFKRKGT